MQENTFDIKTKKISVVVPVLNEEQNVPLICGRITEVLNNFNFEIIFVDDGSTDGTLEQLMSLSAKHANINFISLSRNWGHQCALKAGLDHATGDCVISIDGDLQHPPELMLTFIDKWAQGADIVHSVRKEDPNLPFLKKFTSSTFYKIINKISNLNIKPGTADFRLLDRKVVEACRNLNEDVYFWRGIIPWLGFTQEYIEYEPNSRQYGKSKYNLKKMLGLAINGVASFSLIPLRAASLIGSGILLIALVYLAYIIIQFLIGNTVPGWSSIMAAILILGAIQLIFLGTIGEYVGKTYLGSKKRPTYFIKKMNAELLNNNLPK
ncbi:glycosyltransferase family 2 protein [Maridesulfovibrio salexigens]|uniref:Glycosyl transferase family 2 n=1 Tax=Maridesulfovibrio salexigens (strain ATCC 14822 / DSM 2638 / NCIMB 8403 / VKM B-1763) TaxID=526222 RepID=C6BU08_MARSD|nr:glycosyltransferase family 2 protein [Maridesulfovibrio salexigens]ACS81717.1 glycosyl transferase family 2 [Maridesulfovibrio salexigens DSM 2638]